MENAPSCIFKADDRFMDRGPRFEHKGKLWGEGINHLPMGGVMKTLHALIIAIVCLLMLSSAAMATPQWEFVDPTGPAIDGGYWEILNIDQPDPSSGNWLGAGGGPFGADINLGAYSDAANGFRQSSMTIARQFQVNWGQVNMHVHSEVRNAEAFTIIDNDDVEPPAYNSAGFFYQVWINDLLPNFTSGTGNGVQGLASASLSYPFTSFDHDFLLGPGTYTLHIMGSVNASADGSSLITNRAGASLDMGAGMDITQAAVPVPAAVWLLGSGLIGLGGLRRKLRR
jgi:hypothetical protein